MSFLERYRYDEKMATVAAVLVILAAASPFQCAPTIEQALATAESSIAELKRMFTKMRPRDCSEIYVTGQNHSGVYNIFPTEDQHASVYCDMELDGGGWTVFQRRGQFGNPVHYFYRNWKDYATGFGDPLKEYWLGNKVLHALTTNKHMTLRIELKNHTGVTLIADYSLFKVENEDDFFKITVNGYTGRRGSDAFSGTNGASFTTYDQDHDTHNSNCAATFRGAWWYGACHASNLNGLNLNGYHDSFADGIEWSKLDGINGLHHYSYPYVEMKMREAVVQISPPEPSS